MGRENSNWISKHVYCPRWHSSCTSSCTSANLLYLPFNTKDGDSKNKLVSYIEMIINASLDVTKLLYK